MLTTICVLEGICIIFLFILLIGAQLRSKKLKSQIFDLKKDNRELLRRLELFASGKVVE